MSKFSDNLKELRHSLNMNQKEFAALIGIAQPSLSGYETGNVSPTLDVLQEIAVKCHVSLDWLCGISSTQNNLNSFLELEEINEIKYEIDILIRLK